MIRRRLEGHRIHRHTSCKNLDVQSAVDLLWYDKRRGVIVVTPSLGLSAAAEPVLLKRIWCELQP
jgi:hypothetical protein